MSHFPPSRKALGVLSLGYLFLGLSFGQPGAIFSEIAPAMSPLNTIIIPASKSLVAPALGGNGI